MLRKIFSLLHPSEICLLLSLSLFALLANLGLLGSAAWLISSAALLPPLYALTLGITAVRALGICRALLRYGERYFTHKTAFAVLGSLRLRLYDVINAQANIPQAGHTQGTILNDLLTTRRCSCPCSPIMSLYCLYSAFATALLFGCLHQMQNTAALTAASCWILHRAAMRCKWLAVWILPPANSTIPPPAGRRSC